MRRTSKPAAVASIVFVSGLLFACTGGGGALPDSLIGSWENDKGLRNARELPIGEQEKPLDTREDPPSRASDSPSNFAGIGGTGGGGTLACSGIVECVLTGVSETCITSNGQTDCKQGGKITFRLRIELKEKNGLCTIGNATLEPDGTFRGDDEDEVGKWSVRGNQLYLSGDNFEGYCFPSSGPVGLIGDDGKVISGSGSSSSSSSSSTSSSGSPPSSSGAGTTSSSGDISIDPGPQGDGGS